MIVKKVTLTNKLGLHARAASTLVATAQQFGSDITVRKDEQKANGKNIMAVMMLQGTPGTELEITCEGEDEQSACEAIIKLIEDRFGESE